MNVVLAAIAPELAEAWTAHCGDRANVRVHHGSILDADVDAVVSPANSYAFMDGGIDRLYVERFGEGVQERLQEAIRTYHGGELLVGAAEIVATEDPAIPWLVAAPTMRVPMLLCDSVAPYLAARAALRLVRHGVFRSGLHAGEPIAAHVKTIAFPGLGTGVGGLDPAICARQVAAALDDGFGDGAPFPRDWIDATTRHQRLYADRARDLQQE